MFTNLSAFRRPPAIAAAIFLFCTPVLAGAVEENNTETLYFDYLTNDVVSGGMQVTVEDEQHLEIDFQYNDRGRGPKLHEQIILGEKGELLELKITGNSYMGAPVDEQFALDAETARWTSTIEKGETSDPDGAMYLAANGSVEQLAILVRQVLLSPGNSMAVLPSGRVSVSALKSLTVSHDGISRDVRLYQISGLEFEPAYIWLDQDLKFFAVGYGGMGMVPQGWAEVMPELQAEIDLAQAQNQKRLATELTEDLGSSYAVKNVQLLDVEKGQLIAKQTVIVKDGLIAAIGDGLPDGFVGKVIDGKQAVLMPGLWDMHTHLSDAVGLLHIAAGVTTARDLGNAPARLDQVRGMFDDGSVIGPRVFAAGVVDGKSPFSAPIDKLASNEQQARQLVRDYAAMGYPQIKVYSSVEPDWVAGIATETHANGMRLSGHIPSYMTTEQAVNAGYDEVQHINMLFLNFLAGPDDDTRTPVRFTLVAEQAATLDLDSQAVQDFITLLKNKGTVIDPTVAIFDNMFRHRSGQLSPSFAMVADHFPPNTQRGLLAGRMDINDENAATYAASSQALLDMLNRLYLAGVTLVAGTDSMAGFGLQRELELYVQAGIPAADVLRLATLGSAEVMSVAEMTGSISVGKVADMVLLPGNPLLDINAIRKVDKVFKGELAWTPSRLYQAVGIEPFD